MIYYFNRIFFTCLLYFQVLGGTLEKYDYNMELIGPLRLVVPELRKRTLDQYRTYLNKIDSLSANVEHF